MPFTHPLGNRIAYDRDGTVMLIRRDNKYGGGWLQVHPQAMRALNSSNGAGAIVPQGPAAGIWRDGRDDNATHVWRVAVIFPEPMRISGIFFQLLHREYPDVWGGNLNWSSSYPAAIWASPNTTNGIDGDWSVVPGEFLSEYVPYSTTNPGNGIGVRVDTGADISAQQRDIKSSYRQVKPEVGVGVQAVNLQNVRGFYMEIDPGLLSSFGSYDGKDFISLFLHFYGHTDTLAVGPILAAWHPTLDVRVPPGYMPWADDVRPSTATKRFRVKNLYSQTATDILISASDEYFAPAPSPASQIEFSLDGSAWASTVTIGSMSPGALSSVIHMRRTTPADSPLGSHSVRVDFSVGSWS